MSDSEDDYMNLHIPDVKPGVAKSREHQRQLRISANRDAVARPLPRHELEAQRRQEALAKPVDATNKGFNLLAKMGFKPGMAIGKPRAEGDEAAAEARLHEPIDLKIKLSRTGLGHETMQKEQQQERCEAHMKQMQERAKKSDELAEDFRKRKRDVALSRVLIGDIVKARKACQDLDLRAGIQKPDRPHLWPVHRRVEPSTSAVDDPLPLKRMRVEEVVYKHFYSNGEEAEPEDPLDELEEEELIQRLSIVDDYVRERHFYCLWCGCAYENDEELRTACPGRTKEDHD
ncbi:Coiled-coil domain-containing protein 75 [Aphelenchoides fujianensis]|nr:Coiled-coil domain-containing protein 75 [Aphelenchoides fujianensis]